MNNGKKLYQGGIWAKDSFRLDEFTEQDVDIYRMMVSYDFYNRIEKMGYEDTVRWYYEDNEGYLMVDDGVNTDGDWLAEMMMDVRKEQLARFKYLKSIGPAGRYIEVCVSVAKDALKSGIHLNHDESLVDDGWEGTVTIGSEMHYVDPMNDPSSFVTTYGGLNVEWVEFLTEEEVRERGISQYMKASVERHMLQVQRDIKQFLDSK
jgi:hypothetical protein